MTLIDRIAIETGICHKDSFRKIALFLHRHPSTIAHEVKENRTFLPGSYYLGKDCYFVQKCKEHHVCGDSECTLSCCRCRFIDCRTKCPRYRSTACHRFEKPPYPWNISRLTQKNLDLYLSEFGFRFNCRNMNLFERLVVAVGSSFLPD